MKIISFVVCVLLSIGIFCHVSAENNSGSKAKAIQIVTPVNHTFRLEFAEFQSILEADEIKDRHVVVVSIAGAFRKGKSFLLNFFIRYLYAQYKKHDVTDWLGENEVSTLDGFRWRGGRKPETTGIWMWSEIFAHDFDDGEKVAIILLDTQGIFDHRSSTQDCTETFALSMMLSSVQCYNIMQNIQENDLQHLDLFAEYGRLALEQTNEKPFQNLLFIIRDWPFAYETHYGWSQNVIDEVLTINDEQTAEMQESRQRIKASFEHIGTFLMPYPGMTVAQSSNYIGDLKQIHPDFIKYLKELVPSIFAPENLVVKRINGEKIRARDLVQYLWAYLDIFNGGSLPEPKTVLTATAVASNMILFNDMVNLYERKMQQAIDEISPFFDQLDLLAIHETAKNESISKFINKRKLGNDEVKYRIENTTEVKFEVFKRQNEAKRKIWIEKANLHNERISYELKSDYEKDICSGIENIPSLTPNDVNQLLTNTKQTTLDQFDQMKIGDEKISSAPREKLRQDLDDFQQTTDKTMNFYKDTLSIYSNLMDNFLNNVDSYASENALEKMHHNTRIEVISQFQTRSQYVDVELKSPFQRKIEKEIDRKFQSIAEKNEIRRGIFITKAKLHNQRISQEIEQKYTTDSLSPETIESALIEYDTRKMGDYEVSGIYRDQLKQNLNNKYKIKKDNDAATILLLGLAAAAIFG